MKAVRIHEHGGVEALRFEEVREPVPGEDEVQVRVRACALNHSDLNTRNGWYGFPRRPMTWRRESLSFPRILGSDVAGEITTLGSAVHRWAVGERVILYPFVTCGECTDCHEGNDHLCSSGGLVGSECDGGYAEYVVVPARNLLSLPPNLDWPDAAALPVAFTTAWHALISTGNLQRADTVLITAVGSGVGSAALQIAKLVGARTIVLSSDEEKLKRASHIGADMLLNPTRVDLSSEVRRLTDGRGVDVALEVVGAATFNSCLHSVRLGGRLVICGAASGPLLEVDLRSIYLNHVSVVGCSLGTRAELGQIVDLASQGKLNAIIDKVFPLRDAPRAQQLMQERKVFGKLVLVP